MIISAKFNKIYQYEDSLAGQYCLLNKKIIINAHVQNDFFDGTNKLRAFSGTVITEPRKGSQWSFLTDFKEFKIHKDLQALL